MLRIDRLIRLDYFLYLGPPIISSIISLFILVPVTTYYLDPEDFGLFGLIMAVVIPVKGIAASGTRWVLAGNYIRSNKEKQQLLLFNVLFFELILRTLLVVVFLLFAGPILDVLIDKNSSANIRYIQIALLAIWINSFWPTISFLMIINRNPGYHAMVSTAQVVSKTLVCVIGLWKFDLGVEVLFYALLVSNGVSLLLEFNYIYAKIRLRFSIRWIKEIILTGFRSVPGAGVEMLSQMTERTLIQRFAGFYALGIYNHSQQYRMLFNITNQALGNTITPKALSVYTEGCDSSPLSTALSAWYGVLAIMGSGVALFTKDIINFLAHGKFNDAVPLVMIWFLLMYSLSHGISYSQFLLARSHTKVLMYTQFVPALIGILLLAIACYYVGVIGAALSVFATNALTQITRYRAAKTKGYKNIAEHSFMESIIIFCIVWAFSSFIDFNIYYKIIVFLLVAAFVTWRYRLISELRSMLIRFL